LVLLSLSIFSLSWSVFGLSLACLLSSVCLCVRAAIRGQLFTGTSLHTDALAFGRSFFFLQIYSGSATHDHNTHTHTKRLTAKVATVLWPLASDGKNLPLVSAAAAAAACMRLSVEVACRAVCNNLLQIYNFSLL